MVTRSEAKRRWRLTPEGRAAAAAARATWCHWCGEAETHVPVVECVDAEEILSALDAILTGDDDWDCDEWTSWVAPLGHLSSELGDASTLQAATYPYCCRKCRHEARSAGEDDATAVPRLEARRSALHVRVSEACRRAEVASDLRAWSKGPTFAVGADARARILSVLGLTDAPQDVQDAVIGCLVGVVCSAGTFEMGSPTSEEGRGSNETQHRVTLTRAFAISTYPVVQALWQAVMGANPSRYVGPTRPVEQVSWKDCVAFCDALNRLLGLPVTTRGDARIVTSDGFRLPTEAEWECAARAGQQTVYAGGNDPSAVGWVEDNSGGETHPVGQKHANAWGLHDMSGNVWEWCWDVYGDYPAGAVIDPAGATEGPYRVVRGGSWFYAADGARAAGRGGLYPGYRYGGLGVRLSRTIP